MSRPLESLTVPRGQDGRTPFAGARAGRGGGTRTHGLVLPKHVRCQLRHSPGDPGKSYLNAHSKHATVTRAPRDRRRRSTCAAGVNYPESLPGDRTQIGAGRTPEGVRGSTLADPQRGVDNDRGRGEDLEGAEEQVVPIAEAPDHRECLNQSHDRAGDDVDRKSTRLNSSHMSISYAVFCLK